MDKCLQSEIVGRDLRSRLRRLVKAERGSELFEVALVLPILFMLLIGIVWLGRAFSIYQAVSRAAREGARAALAPTCATCGNTRTTQAEVDTVVDDVLTAATIDTSNPGLAITLQRNLPLNPADPANYQVSGVSVTVSYPVQLTIPFTTLNGTTITISSTASMRQEF
jgi:Flp pilus assembly protein TadG